MSADAAEHNQSNEDWDAWRERFPIFANKTYINSCSCGAIATDVIDALQAYVNDRLSKGVDWEDWVGEMERVRHAVAALLNAGEESISVTASASAGINAIASALDFSGARNKVVISEFAFPTNAQIWYAQQQRGANIVQLAERDRTVSPEQFAEAIDEETLLVAVSHVCYRNGSKLDIAAIAELARENGALLLIDAYQTLGTMAFDVHDIDADFVVGGMVKYLLGTAGIGFLYTRPELIERLVPSVTGWFAQSDIMAMDNTRYHPSPTARRFEAGTPPVVNSYAARAGLAIVNEIGLPAIQERISMLTTMIKDRARERGYQFAMPDDPRKHGAMISLRSHNEHELVDALTADNIVTSYRGGNLRISPHFYNNERDIDHLFDSLERHEKLLVRQ